MSALITFGVFKECTQNFPQVTESTKPPKASLNNGFLCICNYDVQILPGGVNVPNVRSLQIGLLY